MQYLGFVFGIFGLMAYLELSEMKKRVSSLEEELTKLKGTAYHEERTSLLQAARSYIGEKVRIELKEDQGDVDIINYGNTKYGSIVIQEADDTWLKITIESPRGRKEKLIRMESIERITLIKE